MVLSSRAICATTALLFALIALEVFVAPYTKVEESFNVQAMHDLLYTDDVAAYDHLQFSGVVPRTFLGAIVVTAIAAPFVRLVDFIRIFTLATRNDFPSLLLVDAIPALIVCRLVLGFLSAVSIVVLAMAVGDSLTSHVNHIRYSTALRLQTAMNAQRKSKVSDNNNSDSDDDDDDDEDEWESDDEASSSEDGDDSTESTKESSEDEEDTLLITPQPWAGASWVAPCFCLLVAVSHPHVIFYASRPLPNTYALILVNIAMASFLRGYIDASLVFLGMTMTVFRADIAAFVAAYAVMLLVTKNVTLLRGVFVGGGTVAASIAVSTLVDSYLWQRWLWPEGEVLFFNTVKNESHRWGVSPWYWYAMRLAPLGLFPVLVLLLGLKLWRSCFSLSSPTPGDAAVSPPDVVTGNVTLEAALKAQATPPGSFVTVFIPPDLFFISVASLVYVALLSFLPHKEVRFILPCFPSLVAPVAAFVTLLLAPPYLNEPLAASDGSASAVKAGILRLLTSLSGVLILLLLAASGALHGATVVANHFTYPGGYALRDVNANITAAISARSSKARDSDARRLDRAAAVPLTTVFIDAYAGMTGVSRFGKLRPVVDVDLFGTLKNIPNSEFIPFSATGRVTYSKDPDVHNVTRLLHEGVSPALLFDYAIIRAEDWDYWTEHPAANATSGAGVARYKAIPGMTYTNGVNLVAWTLTTVRSLLGGRRRVAEEHAPAPVTNAFIYVARQVERR